MARGYEPRLNQKANRWALIAIPAASVLLGSLSALLPFIASYPLLPPFGLILLLAWRSLVRDLWPAWAALFFGFFDDLFSGQPMGSAMLLWTAVFLILDTLDRWMMWRSYRQDWWIATLLISVVLTASVFIANTDGVFINPLIILPQIIVSILLFPLSVRLCAWLDQLRWRL